MPINYREIAFEDAIESYLTGPGGYEKGERATFDPERGLDPTVLMPFIRETQPREWDYLQNILKNRAEATLLDELGKALASEHEGCLRVLRHGFKCYGKSFRIVFFAPASGLNPESQRLYAANRLTITRQLKYSHKHHNTIDVVLSLNGLPMATLELKNQLTGQTWRNAIRQYQDDRDPNDLIFQFKKRTLVHFAVDTDEAYMTTQLKGKSTYFLPFNKGHQCGAGNPENPHGCKTAYLWEDILSRDSFMDILARFVQKQVEEKRIGGKKIAKETILFPRYQQLDCVRKLIADASSAGPGKNYLIEHSAGSGKSNSISWLAHRLSTLHNKNDNKIFDSVIVITDRLVLDQQLQNTIYEFEHKKGVVAKIEKDSTELAEALQRCDPIIITTLQKFPFVTEKIGELPELKYAVIIDEAHSSQSGESATELKAVLSQQVIKAEAKAKVEDEGLPDYEEEIIKTMARRGRQPNISFFAFTATPKYKTMEIFGQPGADGKPEPFHLYSMRQAIEEGFILDVLKHYTTYQTYYKLVKAIADDPEVDKRKAARALVRYLSLHPHNIEQKTRIMVEHFRSSTRHKIGGKAKAMVVTSSRLHAVRYKLAFDKYIQAQGYSDLKALVAFSGTVVDPDLANVEYTEVKMNGGLKEKELPEKFATSEYQFLIVAEKYQTGFDEPFLHTMYVDKRLAGVQAVQTLSRLNRKPQGKEDTFVLDFVNDTQEILDSFQPYYQQTTVGERAEPRQLYELQARLEEKRIFYLSEIEEFARIFFKPGQKRDVHDHARLNAVLDPCVKRFKELADAEKDDYRKLLVAYKNLYAFLTQVIPFQDFDLEKLYAFVRFLLTKTRRDGGGHSYDFDEEVALQYYRLEKIFEGQIELLKNRVLDVHGPVEVGTGADQKEQIHLSRLIDILNERFGKNFVPADQLFVDAVLESALADSKIRKAAEVNSIENFGYVFKKRLDQLFIERIDANEEFTAMFMNEPDFRKIVTEHLTREVFATIHRKQAKPYETAADVE